jgi:hypothetical protein
MKEIDSFKEVMHQGMLENFKKDGFLQPLIFLLYKKENEIFPIFKPLEGNFMGNYEYKKDITEKMHIICESPLVLAAGIITEAYGAKISNDNEISKKLLNGDIRVSELKEKEDIIILTFNTRVSEEIIAYVVDVKNKTIVEKYPEASNYSGMFSGFFGWKKN